VGGKVEKLWRKEFVEKTSFEPGVEDSRKWSAVSCRSSAEQQKFAGQRPTFYHCATQPTNEPTNESSREQNFQEQILPRVKENDSSGEQVPGSEF